MYMNKPDKYTILTIVAVAVIALNIVNVAVQISTLLDRFN